MDVQEHVASCRTNKACQWTVFSLVYEKYPIRRNPEALDTGQLWDVGPPGHMLFHLPNNINFINTNPAAAGMAKKSCESDTLGAKLGNQHEAVNYTTGSGPNNRASLVSLVKESQKRWRLATAERQHSLPAGEGLV